MRNTGVKLMPHLKLQLLSNLEIYSARWRILMTYIWPMAFGCGTGLNARLRQLCKRNCIGTARVIFTCPGAHPDGPRHWTRALTLHRTTQTLHIMQPFISMSVYLLCEYQILTSAGLKLILSQRMHRHSQ